jgi:hypothetical protein
MSNQIFVVLPSNTPGYAENAPNKFSVQLPKPLDLSSGNWVCGLHSISYVYSWHTVGTINAQWLQINFVNGANIKIPVPRMSFDSAKALEKTLMPNIKTELENHLKFRENVEISRVARDTSDSICDVDDAVKPYECYIRYRNRKTGKTTPLVPRKEPEKANENSNVIQNAEKIPIEAHSQQTITVEKTNLSSQNVQTVLEINKDTSQSLSRSSLDSRSSLEPLELPVAEALRHEPLPLRPLETIYEKITGKEWVKGVEYSTENAYFPSNFSNEEITAYVNSLIFMYVEDINRFKFKIDGSYYLNHIESISFSPQLGYILGFENSAKIKPNEMAKYSTDLKAGINSFGVYLKGITENMICGNELVSLIRVISISGGQYKHGDTIEKIYDSPMYLKVQPKNINTIEVELRTIGFDGRLLPFEFGNTIITLVFKKILTF